MSIDWSQVKSSENTNKPSEIEVKNIIENTAISMGYDSSYSLVSYYNSSNETWKNEAIKFSNWRDKVWEFYFKNKDNFSIDDLPRI